MLVRTHITIVEWKIRSRATALFAVLLVTQKTSHSFFVGENYSHGYLVPKHLPLLVGAIRCLSLTLSRQLFYLPVSSLGFVAAVVSKTLQLEGLLHRSLVNELNCPCYHALRFVHWMSSPSPDPTGSKEVSNIPTGRRYCPAD
ncbi:hypothetical protein DER46DRAFT_153128 [Fusarium sp. MPI-SDFR-AT-0072]|nr:hypothetical protein DER46DRAFT_153128 [Fusarium sp. MPI-SDFR-AT-0072]